MTTWSGVVYQVRRATLLDTPEWRNPGFHRHATLNWPRNTPNVAAAGPCDNVTVTSSEGSDMSVFRAARHNNE